MYKTVLCITQDINHLLLQQLKKSILPYSTILTKKKQFLMWQYPFYLQVGSQKISLPFEVFSLKIMIIIGFLEKGKLLLIQHAIIFYLYFIIGISRKKNQFELMWVHLVALSSITFSLLTVFLVHCTFKLDWQRNILDKLNILTSYPP